MVYFMFTCLGKETCTEMKQITSRCNLILQNHLNMLNSYASKFIKKKKEIQNKICPWRSNQSQVWSHWGAGAITFTEQPLAILVNPKRKSCGNSTSFSKSSYLWFFGLIVRIVFQKQSISYYANAWKFYFALWLVLFLKSVLSAISVLLAMQAALKSKQKYF